MNQTQLLLGRREENTLLSLKKRVLESAMRKRPDLRAFRELARLGETDEVTARGFALGVLKQRSCYPDEENITECESLADYVWREWVKAASRGDDLELTAGWQQYLIEKRAFYGQNLNEHLHGLSACVEWELKGGSVAKAEENFQEMWCLTAQLPEDHPFIEALTDWGGMKSAMQDAQEAWGGRAFEQRVLDLADDIYEAGGEDRDYVEECLSAYREDLREWMRSKIGRDITLEEMVRECQEESVVALAETIETSTLMRVEEPVLFVREYMKLPGGAHTEDQNTRREWIREQRRVKFSERAKC